MCGILGTVIHNGEAELRDGMFQGLRAVEYRGYDSAGVAVLNGSGVAVEKRAGKIGVLEEHLGSATLVGTVAMGHTRWATHGAPTDANAHPHQDNSGRITIVHNGIIENYELLKAELQAQGIVFHSETDTEVAANLIASLYKGNLPEAVMQAARRLQGSFSIVVMAADKPRELVGIRHKLPMLVGHGENATYIGSDVTAFLHLTRTVTYLGDGEMVAINAGETTFYNWRSGEVIEKPREVVEWDIDQAQKGGFDTFMIKEIHEQPEAVRAIIERAITSPDEPVNLPELGDFPELLNAQLISLLGCGTAYHACYVGKYVIEGMAKIPCRLQYAHEALYHQAPMRKDMITIAVSQSGETADTIGAVETQKELGSSVLAVCNVVGSSLTRLAERTIYTKAGPEISVASTKAFTCQLAVIYLIALWLAERRGSSDPAEIRRLKEELLAIPDKMASVLPRIGEVEQLARVYRQVKHFYYLGRGISYPVAMEGALKLKEISYVHAEGYAGGEMKHGAIALIEPGFPSCIIAPKSPLLDKMVANMEQVLGRKGEVMVITNAPERFEHHDVHVFAIPDCPQVFSPLLVTLPLQVFAYYSARLRDCDIDQPRNLAKSVVVE